MSKLGSLGGAARILWNTLWGLPTARFPDRGLWLGCLSFFSSIIKVRRPGRQPASWGTGKMAPAQHSSVPPAWETAAPRPCGWDCGLSGIPPAPFPSVLCSSTYTPAAQQVHQGWGCRWTVEGQRRYGEISLVLAPGFGQTRATVYPEADTADTRSSPLSSHLLLEGRGGKCPRPGSKGHLGFVLIRNGKVCRDGNDCRERRCLLNSQIPRIRRQCL